MQHPSWHIKKPCMLSRYIAKSTINQLINARQLHICVCEPDKTNVFMFFFLVCVCIILCVRIDCVCLCAYVRTWRCNLMCINSIIIGLLATCVHFYKCSLSCCTCLWHVPIFGPICQSWALSVFFHFSNNKKWFFLTFFVYKVNNLFLHQSFIKSPLPVKLTW